MSRLSLLLPLLLAFVSFTGARNINLSKSDMETIAKALNVAFQPDANEKHKLLERINVRGDRDGSIDDDTDDNYETGPSNDNGSNNGNRNGNNGNHNGNVYLQIFIGNQEPTQPTTSFPTWPTDWTTTTTWPTDGTTEGLWPPEGLTEGLWTPDGTTDGSWQITLDEESTVYETV